MGFFARLFKREKERQLKKLSLIADQIEELDAASHERQNANQAQIFKEGIKRGKFGRFVARSLRRSSGSQQKGLDMRHLCAAIGGIVMHKAE